MARDGVWRSGAKAGHNIAGNEFQKIMLKITCDNLTLRMSYEGAPLIPMLLNLESIYGLDPLLTHEERRKLIADGIFFDIDGPIPEGAYPLYMETLWQALYLHTVYYLYPKISTKSQIYEGEAPEDFEHYRNGLVNMPLFRDLCHCQILKNMAQGRPVVIVSPGPSLDLELLARLKGRAYILAVGRTLPRLIQGGVVPDFLYIQDTSAQAWSDIFDFPGCPEVVETALIANPVGHLDQYAHRVRHVYKAWNYYLFEQDEMPKIDEISPSSASGAFSLAIMLGAGEILFVGNDCGGLGAPPFYCSLDLDDILRQGAMPVGLFTNPSYFRLETPQGPGWTTNDYITSVQWLKSRAFDASRRLGIRFYDNSTTGYLRCTGIMQPIPGDYCPPPLPELRLARYPVSFHPEPSLKRERGRFAMILRTLEKSGRILPVALEHPFNAVFQGIPDFSYDGFELDETHLPMVMDRLRQVVELLDRNLAVQW